jgi:hypothetical protein
VKNKLKIKISNKFVPIESLPNYETTAHSQLMFPHTNNSTANFCYKSVVQGGEQEIEVQY